MLFDSKVDKGIFLGYSDTSKAYVVFNTRTLVVDKSIHVKFNDGLTTDRRLSNLGDDFCIYVDWSIYNPKTDEVKQFEVILPQTKGSYEQQP